MDRKNNAMWSSGASLARRMGHEAGASEPCGQLCSQIHEAHAHALSSLASADEIEGLSPINLNDQHGRLYVVRLNREV